MEWNASYSLQFRKQEMRLVFGPRAGHDPLRVWDDSNDSTAIDFTN